MPTEKHRKQAREAVSKFSYMLPDTQAVRRQIESVVAAALESAHAEGSRAEFDRGWRQAEGEIAAAIPCDYKTLHAGKLWVLKMEELIRAAEERGKREAATRCAEIAGTVPKNPFGTGDGAIGWDLHSYARGRKDATNAIRAEFGIEEKKP